MKKNLILGLFLISVLLISVVGIVSAAKNLPYGLSCSSSGECSAGNICLSASTGPLAGQGYKCQPSIEEVGANLQGRDRTLTSSTNQTRNTTSSSSARKSSSSACPRGWDTLAADDNLPCCRKAENKGRSLFRGRFLGKLFE